MTLLKFFFSILVFFSSGQTRNNSEHHLTAGSMEFIHIEDNLYVSKYEVSNSLYDKFLRDYGLNEKTRIYPEGWNEGEYFRNSNFQDVMLHYTTDEIYKNFPVVNVRQDGAALYCDWFTSKYSDDITGEFSNVKFRLPTSYEYSLIYNKYSSLSDKNERLGYNLSIEGKGEMAGGEDEHHLNEKDFCNLKYLRSLHKEWIPNSITWPVCFCNTGEPPIYHLYGNVSEWTSEYCTALGGNWTTLDSSKIRNKVHCELYSPKIGFRVMLEIMEE